MRSTLLNSVALLRGLQFSQAAILIHRQTASACSETNKLIAQAVQAGSALEELTIPADVAYNCLKEIPCDAEKAVLFAQEVRKHVVWQSDLAALKNPPDGSPANDVLQKLSDLEQKAKDHGYTAQLDFDTDLKRLFESTNDGHFYISGLCTHSIYSFSIPKGGLVSVAATSTSEPQIYEYADTLSDNVMGPITTIHGQEASTFLEEYAKFYDKQDADARYNSLFSSFARRGNSEVQRGLFSNAGKWQGYSELAYTFANGTEATWSVSAGLQKTDSYDYETGQHFFDAFCLTGAAASVSANITNTPNPTPSDGAALLQKRDAPPAPSEIAPVAASLENFPEPRFRDDYNQISGYYLNGSHSDIAVLVIPTFDTNGDDDLSGLPLPADHMAKWGQIAAKFLQDAKSEGKTKLIIDLSGNGGGSSQSGYNLFRAFFPKTEIYSRSRSRNHEFFRLLIEALQTWGEDNPNPLVDEIQYLKNFQNILPEQVHPNQSATGWKTYTDWLGPEVADLAAETAFANFSRWSTPDFPIAGYGPVRPLLEEPPFQPENILLVTDGACASTCSIFVAAMMASGNITSTLAWGGRPKSTSMQLVGGVRGSFALQFNDVFDVANFGLTYIKQRINAGKPVLSEEKQARFEATMPRPPKEFPLKFTGGSINFRNAYDPGNDDILQFDHQAAGCHLFYTLQNIREPSTTWDAAADAWKSNGCKAPAKAVTNNQTQSHSSANTNNVSMALTGSLAAFAVLMFAVALF